MCSVMRALLEVRATWESWSLTILCKGNIYLVAEVCQGI